VAIGDLREQRQATRDLIDSQPVDITLLRENEIHIYGGVGRGEPIPQIPRKRYLTPLRRLTDIPDTNKFGDLGSKWMITHVLVGDYDDDIVRDDEFELDEVLYRIVDVERRGGYETRALCATQQITHD
jgi:hypothetical protein